MASNEETSLILNHDEVPDDPHISMRSIRVMFHDRSYTYQTTINGTRKEIGEYFRGNAVNVASFPNETMRMVARLEFLDDDKPTIVMELL